MWGISTEGRRGARSSERVFIRIGDRHSRGYDFGFLDMKVRFTIGVDTRRVGDRSWNRPGRFSDRMRMLEN